MQSIYATNLRNQQRRKERFYRNIIIHKFDVGRHICRDFKLTGAFRAGPKIHDMTLIYIFRPFGSDQRFAALSAGHSVVGAACGCNCNHDDLLICFMRIEITELLDTAIRFDSNQQNGPFR